MSTMIRKQIYIEPEQEAQLKQLASRTGMAEAEIIRQAIDQYVAAARRLPRNRKVWEEEEKFIAELMAQGPVEGGRTWRREDLYER